MDSKFLTVNECAKSLGINADRVRSWIRTGELRATNVADCKTRCYWRIDPIELAKFLERRGNTLETKAPTPKRYRPRSVKSWV